MVLKISDCFCNGSFKLGIGVARYVFLLMNC